MAFNVRKSNLTEVLEKQNLPYEQIKLENIVIKLKDGCKLSAHIWLPTSAYEGKIKVGALVEYIPYRKNDCTSMRDAIRHPYYAGNGLASIRIDMRGSGDSDGVLYDEYLKQEQDDCLECFDWIISQCWSNGNIGMFGKSWGGFNGLQVAARQHPALKTVISLMSTDDRYSDDVHYKGGCILASDMLWWASTMFVYNARPQDPKVVGESWKENWLERLEVTPFSVEWLTHQARDKYWKHGSICEDYSKVDIPVLVIGGWRDGYTSAVFRMAENLPHKDSAGIVGPWVHEYPEMAEPSPKIGYQQLSLKWFKKYLDVDSKVTIELPKMTAYVQDPSDIEESYTHREGKWISLSELEKTYKKLYLGKNRNLRVDHEENFSHIISSQLSHGKFRGSFCPFGFKGDFPSDQKTEDALCTTYDSDEFRETYDLLGEPLFVMKFTCDKPLANISVRISDIYPSNEVALISWGMLNLTHRDSHEHPKVLEIGKTYEVEVKLDVLGISIKKGHKIRLSLSTMDWPSQWPSPELPTLKVISGCLKLPLINRNHINQPPSFEAPSIMEGIKTQLIEPFGRDKFLHYSYITNEWSLTDIHDAGMVRLPEVGTVSGIEFGSKNINIWKCKDSDPLSAYNECNWSLTMRRGDEWDVKLETTSKITSTAEEFILYNKIIAFSEGIKLKELEFKNSIPRKFV